MRVLIADKLATSAVDALRAAGHEVAVEPSLGGEALAEALGRLDPDVLVVRSTKVGAAQLEAGRALSLVVRAGAGVNTIDLDAAGRRGVFVANCPGKNAVAVAELTFALLLALDRHVADGVVRARAGQWDKAAQSRSRGLRGRRLGLLGLGGIGREVARRALAFDLEVVAWSRSLTPEAAEELGITWAGSPLEVARQVDILSVHTALTPDTRGLVGRSLIDALPDGAVVINTARAEVMDEEALLDALERRGFQAGLDVLAGEPSGSTGTLDHPLARHPHVVLSHHVGASTEEAQEAVAAEVVRIVTAYDATGRAPNVVNVLDDPDATHVLVVRHLDRVGVLAGVLDALREADLNVQGMENTIFAGGEAAVARVQVGSDPAVVVDHVAALPHVLHVASLPIGGSRG
ncbi:MAG: hydroxyacid dehydrogenase [Alphaproteobacteria bacterium]|nr:hydroxyacid dehydrogenase [Alphaproteobacteria bacterium]